MKKNIIITGVPRVGKSTLMRKIIRRMEESSTGLLTSEIIKEDKRAGFKMSVVGFENDPVLSRIIAHVKFYKDENPKVGKYGVNVDAIKDANGSETIL